MGIHYSALTLQLELWKRGFYKNVHSVADMGSQELHLDLESFHNLVSAYEVPNIVKADFKNLENYPGWPRVAAKAFYHTLGIKNYNCIDLGCDHGAIKIDLNYPLEDNSLRNKFDLVTDFGNNEHPFNVCEAYRTMHTICKPGGLMIIDQCLIGGNGYYNFDIGFFEGMAAANNYDILFSAYGLPIPSQPGISAHIPLVPELINLFDWSKIKGYIGLTYVFRKKEDKDFCIPYQGGYQFEFQKTYKQQSFLYKLPSARTYVSTNVSLSNWSAFDLTKELVRRVRGKLLAW